MADHTKIEWTDHTWSPVTGCTKVSEGCRNCYIERTPPLRMEGRGFGCPRCGGSGYVEDADGNRFSPNKARGLILGARCASCDGSGRRGVGDTTGVRLHEDRLDWPLRKRSWRGKRVFVCSMADLFHDAVPSSFIADVFAVMSLTPEVTYQVLTKRPVRMRSLLNSGDFHWRVWHAILTFANDGNLPLSADLTLHFWGGAHLAHHTMAPLPNVWLGVSVEDQKAADLRIPALLETPAAVRFLSCEPLLGPVRLLMDDQYVNEDCRGCSGILSPAHEPGNHWEPGEWSGIDWVIVGGESGPKARPMHPDWARSLRDQCVDAGVPFFFKQCGEWTWDDTGDGRGPDGAVSLSGEFIRSGDDVWLPEMFTAAPVRRVGKKAAGRLLDGRTHDEFPGGAS